MSWDESLFRSLLKNTARLFPKAPETPERAARVELSWMTSRLVFLARALTGEALELREAEAVGGYSGNILLLPKVMDLFPDPALNAKSYLFRVAFSCFSRSLKMGASAQLSEEERARATQAAFASTFQRMQAELPAIEEFASELGISPGGPVPFKLIGLLQPAGEVTPGGKSAPATEIPADALSTGTERKGKAREKVEVVELGEDKLDESPLIHVFEKVRTAEEYLGGKKSLDGSDELEDQAEALEELDLRKVIRTRERTRSVFKSDALLESSAPDLEDGVNVVGKAFFYDEWAGKSYRENWCSVFEIQVERRLSEDAARKWVSETLQAHCGETEGLRRRLSSLLNERSWRNRQLDGTEIDLEAIVDRYATFKSGHSPSEKLYLRKRKHRPDFATLILLDGSLSTDSWVANRRVLDVERESVLILSEVLAGIHEEVAVGAFHSNTRRDCRYLTLKGFHESWGNCRSRLASLEPAGYTRIGPALRHATALLEKTAARKKLLLLISDGKPTDYDRYEGSYGIADVRQAIREASRKQIRIQALAVDSEAKFHIPQMFGEGNFQILSRPGALTSALTRIYGELLK